MKRWRKRLYSAACTLCFAVPSFLPLAANENSATLTLDQARVVAARALHAGDAELARKLAMGLVQADPEDAYAYGVLAAAHAKLNNPDLARAAARLSYKHSETAAQSYGAARTAGRIAFQQKRFNASQLWLRRAAFHAPTEQNTKQLGKDYATVRAANPLSLRFNFSLAPSDNVNNGSDATQDIINGIPQAGTIGVSSRALSGIVGTADVSLSYRLKRTRTSQTFAIARAYTRRVALSHSARAAAPRVTNSSLASTFTEIGLRHSFVLNKKGAVMTLRGTGGKAWSAGSARYTFGKLQISPTFRLSKATSLSLSGSIEQRWSTIDPLKDQTVSQLRATLSHKLERGDKISFGVNLSDVDTDARNGAYRSGNLTLNYAFGKQMGPMLLSTGLTVGHTDFSVYSATIPVAGGRQDLSVYGDVTMLFTDYDIAGFAPTLRVRAGRKSSNVSRFETKELSVSLGIQ